MYCSNCGNKVDEDAYVCLNCGVILKKRENKVKSKKNNIKKPPTFKGFMR